jgi:hypothetical protein
MMYLTKLISFCVSSTRMYKVPSDDYEDKSHDCHRGDISPISRTIYLELMSPTKSLPLTLFTTHDNAACPHLASPLLT